MAAWTWGPGVPTTLIEMDGFQVDPEETSPMGRSDCRFDDHDKMAGELGYFASAVICASMGCCRSRQPT